MSSSHSLAFGIGEIEPHSPLDGHHAPDEDEGHSDNSLEEVQDEEIPLYFNELNERLYHSHPTSPYPLPVDTPGIEVCTLFWLESDPYLLPAVSAPRRKPQGSEAHPRRKLFWPRRRYFGCEPLTQGFGYVHRKWDMVE